MAASVLFACGLNEQKLPSFIHISEESDIDGSFLISSILGQRLRISNSGTLLVCLQHCYMHYFNAGMRLGYNCNIFLGKTLSVIDTLTDMSRDFLSSKWLTKENPITDLLYADIRDLILSPNFTTRINTTVIIDNLAILYNLGATKEDVQKFCHGLAYLSQAFQNLTIITKMSNCDIYNFEDNNVAKLGSSHIRVVKLKSGVFREVDGKLLIKKVQDDTDDNSYQCNYYAREILYKVNDRNIKVFNPGEIGLRA